MSCLTCVALSTGVKRSVSVRRAETPVCPWRGCVLSAALTAASAPTRTPPTHSTPALLPHRARGPTGGWSHVDGCPDNTEVTLQSSLMLMSGCFFFCLCCSMSEDDSHESGCDTVEGSPTDTSASLRGNGHYRFLDNGNHNHRPPLASVVAALPPPAVQGRSPRGVRTMVVPPMRAQNNNNSQVTEERVQRTGQCGHVFTDISVVEPFVCFTNKLTSEVYIF